MEYSDLFSGDEGELREEFVTQSEGLEFCRQALAKLVRDDVYRPDTGGMEYSAWLVAKQMAWLEGIAGRNRSENKTPSDSVR